MAFNLSNIAWSVNVQRKSRMSNGSVEYCLAHKNPVEVAHSRELACLQACSAILRPHDRLFALNLSHSTHLSKYFTTIILTKHGSSAIDSGALNDILNVYRPRVFLSSASACHQLLDHQAIGTICKSLGIYVVADITETSGLLASGLIPSPFENADIVITGTQGSLRGPSGGLIFSRKTARVQQTDITRFEASCSLGDAIDQSVFPGHQGGPHNHAILAKAVALKQVSTHAFKAYQRLAMANAEALTAELLGFGYYLDAIDTPTHHLVIKLRETKAITVKQVLDAVGVMSIIVVAENELHIGTLAMTSRGLLPSDFLWVADIIHKAVSIAKKLSSTEYNGSVKSFEDGNPPSGSTTEPVQSWGIGEPRILDIRQEIKERMKRIGNFE